MGCSCGGGSSSTGNWKVTKPDGTMTTYSSEADARMEAARNPGSTVRAA